MKKNAYTLNTVLAAVLGIAMLVCILIRTFAPRVILPELDIPNLVLISMVALVLDHYLDPVADRSFYCIALFAAVTFGLLPYAACFVSGAEAAKLALISGVVFPLLTWLFDSIQDRMSTGDGTKAAPALCAFGLYLAAQGLMGMIL